MHSVLVQSLIMTSEAKQWIQLLLLAAFVLATLRTGYIFYRRHEDAVEAENRAKVRTVGYANPDYYVHPKRLYPYDLKSARQLTLQLGWVKEGYRYTFYPYDPTRKHVDFDHEAGLLLPIEKLQITDVVTAMPPGAGQRRQMMAVFAKDGKSFAVPIGFDANGQYQIYSDEMFFVEDPHELYKHWPADVWQAVEQHEVKLGMNELQADFAVGMGVPDAGDSSYSKTVRYPNGGKPLVVVYHEGRAADITPGP